MSSQEECYDADEGPATKASRDRVPHEVAEAHYHVQGTNGNYFIEQLHVVGEAGVEGSVPSNQNYQGSASHELDSDLPPDEVDPEDKGDTHEKPSQKVAQGDQEHDPLALPTFKVSSV